MDEIAFPAEGFTWNALGKLAQRFYADYAELGMDDLLQHLEQAKDQLLASAGLAQDVVVM
jgi:hypothetical protein